MPIYEYACLDCRKRVSVFFRTISVASDEAARCPICEGSHLRRLVSRVAVMKSEDSRMDALADDPSLLSGLESEDPRALAHFMRRMSDEMGEPLDAEMNEVIGRLESGESPDSIEESMPDMGDEMGGDGFGGGGFGGGFDGGYGGGMDSMLPD
ncbi:MAG: zinc ribbon domain-containing protein [Caldilineaceae bacterium]|nr:zinc ribbon domain-containing protein [Caldilineaceae bacterium]